jgi:hypothetical protein
MKRYTIHPYPGKLARWRAVTNESRAMKALRRAKERYIA